MSHSYKPENYNSVSPYFMVSDAERWVKFLRALFDAEELNRYERPGVGLVHAELRIDDSVIMLSQATADYPASPIMMHVYVPDAIATYKKALELGCTGIQEPIQKDDPDLRGMFMDYEGNTWAVGTKED